MSKEENITPMMINGKYIYPIYRNKKALIVDEKSMLYIQNLEDKISMAIEYIKEHTKETNFDNDKLIDILEILGNKEQTKVIVNEDMGIKSDELKNQFNDVWEYGDR